MREKNNKHIIEERTIPHLLRSSGHLPALTEQELDDFDMIYSSYQFKLKDIEIDPDKIINGIFRKKKITQLNIDINETEIRSLNMAARKGQNISQELLNKIKKKHNNPDSSDDK